MGNIDLHVHSAFSDGSDSIGTVIEKAKARNVDVLSFVDHDFTATYPRARETAHAAGIRLIPGVEISAYDFSRDRKVHVLGYDYDLAAPNIRQVTDPLLERRHAHSLRQIEQLKHEGVDVDASRIASRLEPGQTIYKQHIMADITAAHFTSEHYQTLYRRLFKGDGPAAGDIVYADVFEAVRAIRADGGYAVIAHPGQLNSYDLITEVIAAGLDGIEIIHPDHTPADFRKVTALCERYGLFTTGGSDYHGDFGAKASIGIEKRMLKDHPFV
ncbi:PHP domain-containing protein [Salinicoccus albus]|uniref:PHP domain-containing protein n=1 Tax=Salinicoccus albus TaxID=418756 RepID=UPI000375451C|nr:PHP domain-containing protein [Salinicoccus albus]